MVKFNIITAFTTSLTSLIISRPLCIKLDLVNHPNERKTHNGKILLIGGVCIFLGLLISYLFFIQYDKLSKVFLFTSSLILIRGVCDDYTNVKFQTKMAFQAFISIIMIDSRDHIHHFLENSRFSKKLISLLIVSFGLAILLIGIFLENNFPALSFSVFLILFLFYLFIRMYNFSAKKVNSYK